MCFFLEDISACVSICFLYCELPWTWSGNNNNSNSKVKKRLIDTDKNCFFKLYIKVNNWVFIRLLVKTSQILRPLPSYPTPELYISPIFFCRAITKETRPWTHWDMSVFLILLYYPVPILFLIFCCFFTVFKCITNKLDTRVGTTTSGRWYLGLASNILLVSALEDLVRVGAIEQHMGGG